MRYVVTGLSLKERPVDMTQNLEVASTTIRIDGQVMKPSAIIIHKYSSDFHEITYREGFN